MVNQCTIGFLVPAWCVRGILGCFFTGQDVYPVSFSSQNVLIADVKIYPVFFPFDLTNPGNSQKFMYVAGFCHSHLSQASARKNDIRRDNGLIGDGFAEGF